MSIIPAYTYTLTNGTTADANQVMANFNTVLTNVNNNAATNGTNSNITQITGLTTPLTVGQGGTGLGTLTANGLIIGNGTSTPTFITTSVTNSTAFWNGSAWTTGLLPIRSYLAGLTLSNDGTTPNSVLDISAGICTDSTNVVSINLGAFTKSTAGSWAAGSGSNGMGTGLTIASTTWYHVFAIINSGASDVYFDTSVTAANAPSGTTAFRRIGSFLTDGSAHIITFSQNGDEFLWRTPVSNLNDSSSFPTSLTLLTLTVPTGIKVNALFAAAMGAASVVYISFLSPDVTGTWGGTSSSLNFGANSGFGSGQFSIRTNTSGQVNWIGSAVGSSPTRVVWTSGWIDSRGKFN